MEGKIRRSISEATKVWSGSSVLKFREVSDLKQADILVSFQGEVHTHVDDYPMRGSTLAHAFPPGTALGGDIHLREDIEWDFDSMYADKPAKDKTSFFAAVLHEMGHSLGLHHTDVEDAVMFYHIHASTGVLGKDDIEGIHHIYGIPKGSIVQEAEIGTSAPETAPSDLPDKCKTDFDAAARIRGDLFMFKGIHCWRPELQEETMEIRTFWPELPETLTHADAVFVNKEGKIWFFIGREIFVFSATKFEYKMALRDLGIDQRRYAKIDAIFTWKVTGRTFIFSGVDYWRFDGAKVEVDYPKPILGSWRDVYDIDTVLTDKDRLYFLKGRHMYEFDTRRMRINRMNPSSIGSTLMGCPEEKPKHTLEGRFDDDSDPDVILNWNSPDEIPEDEDNIEKVSAAVERMGKSAGSLKIASVQLLLSLIVALLICFRPY